MVGASFGGIDDHEVEAATFGLQIRQSALHVGAHELDAVGEAVMGGDGGARRDRRRRAVDREHVLGAAARRDQRERADIRERVEHTPAARELLDADTVLALVEVVACLLRDRERDAILDAELVKDELLDVGSANDTRLGLEPFELLRALRRDLDDRLGARHAGDVGEDVGLATFHPDGEELHDRRRPEHVDDEPGEVVALGVDEPIAARLGRGKLEQVLAPPVRLLDTAPERGGIERVSLVAGEDADGDGALRGPVSSTEELSRASTTCTTSPAAGAPSTSSMAWANTQGCPAHTGWT